MCALSQRVFRNPKIIYHRQNPSPCNTYLNNLNIFSVANKTIFRKTNVSRLMSKSNDMRLAIDLIVSVISLIAAVPGKRDMACSGISDNHPCTIPQTWNDCEQDANRMFHCDDLLGFVSLIVLDVRVKKIKNKCLMSTIYADSKSNKWCNQVVLRRIFRLISVLDTVACSSA